MENVIIDKLRLTLRFEDSLINFKIQLDKYDKSLKLTKSTQIDNNYSENLLLMYGSKEIAKFDYSFKRRDKVSHIRFNKYSLYYHQDEIMQVFKFLISLDFEVQPSKMEIARDFVGSTIFNSVLSHIQNSKIVQPTNHHVYMGDEIYRENMYTPNNHESFYFRNIDKNKRDLVLRLEDKKKAIEDSKDFYILNYLKKQGLDTSRDIFRFELVFNNLDSFRGSRNLVYFSKFDMTKPTITKYYLNKCKRKVKEFDSIKDIFNFSNQKIEMYREIENEYTIKGKSYHEINVDLLKLFDKDYLLALFQLKSKDLIFNIFDIIPEKHTKSFIKPNKIEKPNGFIQKKSSTKYYSVDEKLLLLIKEKFKIDDLEAQKILNSIETIANNPNQGNRGDLFDSI
ncbi:hypothetical protein LB450_03500 [Psychroflexus sp. CAK1W]|uniref:hypothetical protein n=1 Tax=Psychroflexus curvus TaxID=2873595 RepID=UPI001CCFAB2E|nr:hypothetical protein [Psychroflexus curvus]MBZ9627160.1 hypothetical protein [Psychroflexus curvus]